MSAPEVVRGLSALVGETPRGFSALARRGFPGQRGETFIRSRLDNPRGFSDERGEKLQLTCEDVLLNCEALHENCTRHRRVLVGFFGHSKIYSQQHSRTQP